MHNIDVAPVLHTSVERGSTAHRNWHVSHWITLTHCNTMRPDINMVSQWSRLPMNQLQPPWTAWRDIWMGWRRHRWDHSGAGWGPARLRITGGFLMRPSHYLKLDASICKTGENGGTWTRVCEQKHRAPYVLPCQRLLLWHFLRYTGGFLPTCSLRLDNEGSLWRRRWPWNVLFAMWSERARPGDKQQLTRGLLDMQT